MGGKGGRGAYKGQSLPEGKLSVSGLSHGAASSALSQADVYWSEMLLLQTVSHMMGCLFTFTCGFGLTGSHGGQVCW